MDVQADQVVARLTSPTGTILFGGVDEFGVDWSLTEWSGWSGATAPSGRTVKKARQHGSRRGRGYATGRTVSASGSIFAPTAAALSDAFDRLNEVLPVDVDARLEVSEAGRTRFVDVQRSDDVITDHLMPTIGTWSWQVEATDWRKFGDTVTADTTLPSSAGGITVPLTIPFTIAETTVTGQVSLVNPGNEPGPVRLRIDGPCIGPVVTHLSSGTSLIFASSLVLGPGEWLEIDMEAHTVLANGQSGRNGWVTARGWSEFQPGANVWSFTAAAYNPASRLTVTATPAWK